MMVSSGGLMEEIQALIAPPSEQREVKDGLDLHPYFKRPGKGHNNDRCDSCGESGDLLCCDQCPASFHLICHDPPISVASLPEGDWICHKCKAIEALKLGASPISLPVIEYPAGEMDQEAISVRTPLEYLVQAASVLNPRQFELPNELQVHQVLPDDDKTSDDVTASRRRYIEIESDHIPIHSRLCHTCRRNSHSGILISCDYCSATFHLDCLDPPMSTPPLGSVWMCPLHVEHHIDSKIVVSSRLTERMKLWDKFRDPVDQDSIKLTFLRKACRKNPPFKRKIRRKDLKLVDVPETVKYYYENTSSLFHQDSAKQVFREPSDQVTTCLSDQDLWLESVIRMQVSTAERHLSVSEQKIKYRTDVEHINKLKKNISSSAHVDQPYINGVIHENGIPSIPCEKVQKAPILKSYLTDNNLKQGLGNHNHVDHDISSYLRIKLGMVGTVELGDIDNNFIHLLASQRLSQLIGSQSSVLSAPHSPLEHRASINSLVSSRAILTPLCGFGSPKQMRYRSYSIGAGKSNDLDLYVHGFCNKVSSNHATIFYDDASEQFELLNYSEYGTTVDGVVYTSDTLAPYKSSAVEESIESVVKGCLREAHSSTSCNKSSTSTSACMSKFPVTEARKCWCSQSSQADADVLHGFESSVILHHGSLLKFGCLQFVFGRVQHPDSMHSGSGLNIMCSHSTTEDNGERHSSQ